jgi:hypothetical protein
VAEGLRAEDVGVDPGFLVDFAEGGLGGVFIKVDVAARVQPQADLAVALQLR